MNGENNTVLDVACGPGRLIELMNLEVPHNTLCGLDIDSCFINCARKLSPNYEFEVQDVFNLSRNYDYIVCNLALHHFDQPIKLIKTLCKYANKGLIISDQVRPNTEGELAERMENRKILLGDEDILYYAKNERESILGAYSKIELERIFKRTGIPFKSEYCDDDYYERVVVTF